MPTTSRAILHFFKLLRLARATPVGWNRMRMGAAQGAPRRRRGLWHVCSHARRRGDDIRVEGSIFAMRGLTAPCAPSLVSFVPAQLERVRATTRRLVGRMRTARAHAAMWSAGARTLHPRARAVEGQKEKSEVRAVCHVTAPVSTERSEDPHVHHADTRATRSPFRGSETRHGLTCGPWISMHQGG